MPRASLRRPRPSPRQHVQHVGHLLPLAENEIVAVGLRVVVGVVAQAVADDVETAVGDQRGAGRTGTLLQVVRREDSCEVLRKRLVAQYSLSLFQGIA